MIMRRFTLVFVIALLSSLYGCHSENVVEEVAGTCIVTVLDENSQPFAGAEVYLGQSMETTDSQGRCIFDVVLNCQYTLRVIAFDHEEIKKVIDIKEDVTKIDCSLSLRPASLSLGETEYITKDSKGSIYIPIIANRDWLITSESEELSFSALGGYGRSGVSVEYDFGLNPAGEDFTDAFFKVICAQEEILVKIRYLHPLEVEITSWELPNLLIKPDRKCRVGLRFNRKVKNVMCSFLSWNVEVEMINDTEAVAILPICLAGARRKLYITAATLNDDGVSLSGYEKEIGFYDDIASIEGDVRFIAMVDDETRAWIVTSCPDGDRLCLVDTHTYQVIKGFDLDFTASSLVVSPIDSYLYLIDGRRGVLNKVDPESGAIVETISVESDPRDHPQYPCTFLSSHCFLKDGTGFFLCCSAPSGGGHLWIMDRDKELMYHPYFDQFYNNPYEGNPFDAATVLYVPYPGDKVFTLPSMYTRRGWLFDASDKEQYGFFLYEGIDQSEGSYNLQSPIRVICHKNCPKVLLVAVYNISVLDVDTMDYSGIYRYGADGIDTRIESLEFCYGEWTQGRLCTIAYISNPGILAIRDHTGHGFAFVSDASIASALTTNPRILSYSEGDRVTFLVHEGRKTEFRTINTSRFNLSF